jgi:hypothetical protein
MIASSSDSIASSDRSVSWRFVFFALLGIVVGGLFVARHFTQTAICERLQPGITRSDLVAALGQPRDSESRPDGELLYFSGGLGAAGPIHAIVDSTGHVAMLRCCEDCKSRWGNQ